MAVPAWQSVQGAALREHSKHTAEKGLLACLPPEASGAGAVKYTTAIDMYYYGHLLVGQ